MGTRQHRNSSAGFERLIGYCFRLAIARDLVRIYSDVLRDPIPGDLQKLLTRLEERVKDRPKR